MSVPALCYSILTQPFRMHALLHSDMSGLHFVGYRKRAQIDVLLECLRKGLRGPRTTASIQGCRMLVPLLGSKTNEMRLPMLTRVLMRTCEFGTDTD